MSKAIPGIAPKTIFGKAVLSSTEYIAENAFVAPGFHRLLTAAGLSLGLWGGRSIMDVVTARRASDGTDIPRGEVAEILRPIYGTMRYNPYSDDPSDRWKMIADKTMPMLLGGVGAYLGSRHFAYGKGLTGKAFHPVTENLQNRYQQQLSKGRVTVDTADSMMLLEQGEYTRRIGAVGLPFGSTIGTHLPGALFPFTNGGMSANSFQLTNRLRTNPPFPFLKWLKPILGNRAFGSRALEGSLADALRYGETNLIRMGNPDRWMNTSIIAQHVQNITQNFKHVSDSQRQAITKHLEELYQSAYRKFGTNLGVGTSLSVEAEKKLATDVRLYLNGANEAGHGLSGESYEKLLIDSGFDLAEFQPGYGSMGVLSKHVGSRKVEEKIAGEMASHLEAHYGVNWKAHHVDTPAWKTAAIYSGAAATTAGLLAAGGVAASRINKKLDQSTERAINAQQGVSQASLKTQQVSRGAEANERSKHDHFFMDWMNGKPLDVAQWFSRVAITPPSMHRFMNAAYLSMALWGGMQVANLLTGRKLPALRGGTIAESLIAKDSLKGPLAILKPLHGLLHYTPGSALISDRWRQAAHYIIPVTVGMWGTYTGSYLFFKDRINHLQQPKTLEDYVDKIGLEQSKFYAGATAITSIFNTGSGIHLLPVFNYSSNLHNRYLLASGQQVAMPGIGKWWSGNPGLNPWGVKRSLNYIANYLAFNPAARPGELPSLVYSVVAKLYPHLPDDVCVAKRQAILDRIYEVRDSYLVNDTIPAQKQESLAKLMNKMVTGDGLEMLLLDVGLNPAEANLAHNGASGAIANFFGHGGKVKTMEQEYKAKFTERLASQKQSPKEYLKSLAEHEPKDVPAANDNRTLRVQSNENQSFAERVKQESASAAATKG